MTTLRDFRGNLDRLVNSEGGSGKENLTWWAEAEEATEVEAAAGAEASVEAEAQAQALYTSVSSGQKQRYKGRRSRGKDWAQAQGSSEHAVSSKELHTMIRQQPAPAAAPGEDEVGTPAAHTWSQLAAMFDRPPVPLNATATSAVQMLQVLLVADECSLFHAMRRRPMNCASNWLLRL